MALLLLLKEVSASVKPVLADIMSLVLRLSDVEINRRPVDMKVNLTQLAQAGGKRLNDWVRLEKSQAFLRVLSESTQIPVDTLISYEITGRTERATWGHPQVAINLAQWISPEFDLKVSAWIYELAATGNVALGMEKSRDEVDAAWKQKVEGLEKKVEKLEGQVQAEREEKKQAQLLVEHERKERRRVETAHQSVLLRRRRHQAGKGPAFYIISLEAYPEDLKPGFTKDFADRVHNYDTHFPEDAKLEFLLYSPKAELIEELIKTKYQAQRSRTNREWVHGVTLDDMVAVVRNLVSSYNIPHHEYDPEPKAEIQFVDEDEKEAEAAAEERSQALRAEIIAALQSHAELEGEPPKAQTWKAKRGLGLATVIKVFGSWSNAMAAAGLEVAHQTGRHARGHDRGVARAR